MPPVAEVQAFQSIEAACVTPQVNQHAPAASAPLSNPDLALIVCAPDKCPCVGELTPLVSAPPVAAQHRPCSSERCAVCAPSGVRGAAAAEACRHAAGRDVQATGERWSTRRPRLVTSIGRSGDGRYIAWRVPGSLAAVRLPGRPFAKRIMRSERAARAGERTDDRRRRVERSPTGHQFPERALSRIPSSPKSPRALPSTVTDFGRLRVGQLTATSVEGLRVGASRMRRVLSSCCADMDSSPKAVGSRSIDRPLPVTQSGGTPGSRSRRPSPSCMSMPITARTYSAPTQV